jgi:arylsulfatase A-like enzyme
VNEEAAMRVLVPAALALALCGCTPAPPPAPDPATLPMKYRGANLLFVSFDALQASHVGCLGNGRPTTPNLDALATRSFTFRNLTSVASWTVPASMTWFTGVYPSEHRMTNKFALYAPPLKKRANLKDLSPGLVTLADVLRRDGYATAGFTGNAGVSAGFGYEQGFDAYVHDRDRFGGFDESIPRAMEWLKTNREKKFFLFLHGYDTHGQRLPPEGLDFRFVDRDYDGKYTGSEPEQEALREEGLDKGRLALREADVRFWRAVYDEKIARADAKFGRFLAEFERLGLADNTLVVVTSDHGTEFCEHGRFDHGFTLYQEQLHVPLFIHLPGQRGGKFIDGRSSSIDVMPTLLDLLDADMPEDARRQMRGASLVPALTGGPIPRDAFAETDYRDYTHKRSLLTADGRKLVVTLETGARELYDLNADPGEMNDLAGTRPVEAEELKKRLYDHFRAIGHDLEAKQWRTGLNPVYASQAKE